MFAVDVIFSKTRAFRHTPLRRVPVKTATHIQNGDKTKTATRQNGDTSNLISLQNAVLTCIQDSDKSKTATLSKRRHAPFWLSPSWLSPFWMCRRFGVSPFWFAAVLDVSPFWLSPFWSVAVLICRRFGVSPFWSVAVMACRRFGFVAVLVVAVLTCIDPSRQRFCASHYRQRRVCGPDVYCPIVPLDMLR